MSKEDIDKLDKQIELLKNENNKKVVEKVTTEIKDEDDPNHVINIDYIDSEVNEATKELKDLKNLTENVVEEEKLEDTKKMNINEDNKIIIEEVEDNDSIEEGITVEKNGKKIVKLLRKFVGTEGMACAIALQTPVKNFISMSLGVFSPKMAQELLDVLNDKKPLVGGLAAMIIKAIPKVIAGLPALLKSI